MGESEKIFNTLNKIRKEKFSDVPEEILKKILEIEEDYLEENDQAPREISNLVEDFLEDNNH